jgi:putative ABC transport system permease protein
MGPLFFLLGVTLAAELACRKQLKEVPAALMRPKAPKAGSRVLLERMSFFWKRMGFLSKVTARNLFRYKGRMLMTILGVGGCMALMLFGFSIRDSVNDLCPKQYEKIQRYDLLAVANPADNASLCEKIGRDSAIQDWINVEFTSGKVRKGGQEETVQLVVVPDSVEDFSDYTALYDLDGKKLTLTDGNIYLTENAATVLGISEGSSLILQLSDLSQSKVSVNKIVKNYLTNYIFMTETSYKKYFDSFAPNAVMAHFSKACQGKNAKQKAYGEDLSKMEGLLSVQVVSQSIDEFSGTFRLMNVIVSIVIVMSAALAFTVLFTLSAINMSERERELATIKVLGFYDREVHSYINRETWILTLIGILVGIPLGFAFAQTLGIILKLPGIFLETELHFRSYVYAGGLTLIFALIVQIITNRSLDDIDPVTALKSAE